MHEAEKTPDARSRSEGAFQVRTAVREAVAVLAAILTAFALDAWWVDRREDVETAELLAAIQVEFAQASIQLDSIVALNEAAIDRLSRGIVRTGPGMPEFPSDSLGEYFVVREEFFQIYEPAFGALSTLISAGGLDRVEDNSMQQALAGWLGWLDDARFELDLLNHAARELVQVAVAENALAALTVTDVTAEERAGSLAALSRSEAYRQASALFRLVLLDYNWDVARFAERARDIADQLASEHSSVTR